MAVDDATGQVFVADSTATATTPFTNEVKVFGASGGGIPDYVTAFGAGDLTSPAAIAVDQTSGAIYVGDSGAGRIFKYTSDHAATPTFTQDLTYISPSAGSGAGSIGDFASPMAVDPRNGNLLVADRANHVVSRYSASGAYLGQFDGSGSRAGVFHTPASITVDSAGEIYVVDVVQTPLMSSGGSSVLESFTAAGVADGSLAPVDNRVSAVTYDSFSGNVLVTGNNNTIPPTTPVLYVFHGGSILARMSFPDADTSGQFLTAVAADGNNGRLYGLYRQFSRIGSGVEVFDAVILPTLEVDPATDVTATTATLHGTVDPVGIASSYHFEYSSDGGATASTPDVSVGTTSGPVQQAITGLEPNQTYTVQMVGTNANGSLTTLSGRSFTTQQAVPGTTTGVASDVTENSATLRGTVNPHGLQTTFQFQYGETADYGQTVPADHSDVAGGRHGDRNVQEGISGLKAGTTYHYRLVATSSAGIGYGADHVLLTSAAVPHRVYEQVSPKDKGGSNVNTIYFQASRDGNALAYMWATAPGGELSASSAPLFPRSVATRNGAGWKSVTTDPPQVATSAAERAVAFVNTLAVSEDGTKAVVSSKKALAPGASEGDSNIYMRDNATGAYTTIVSTPGPDLVHDSQYLGYSPYIDGTSDFSHVLLGGDYLHDIVPGDPLGAMYDWSNGHLTLVSTDENGVPFGPVTAGAISQNSLRETHFISDDGHVIAMPQNYGGGVYVRVGDTVYAASKSHATADAGTVHDASYAGMSTDGHFVFIYSHDLTDDSDPGVTSLYRFNTQNQELALLTSVSKPDGWLQTSGNGESVYFLTDLDLAPGSTVGGLNIDVWHNGTVSRIATLDPNLGEFLLQGWMASPNGRYFAFLSYSQFTSYNNASRTACVNFSAGDPVSNYPDGAACAEVYRYDGNDGSLTCASCRTDGGPVQGDATLGPVIIDQGGHQFPRATLDDGRVFFDTPDPVSSKDVNSKYDVYSFDGNQATLISSGKGLGDSKLADVSTDGDNVFFTTQDQLVPSDTDTLTDVYDARVNGGLSSQSPDPVQSCSGDDCRPQGTGPVGSPPASSQSNAPVRKTSTTTSKAKVTVTSASFEGTILRLTVSVSGSGRIRVSGTKLTATTKTTSKAGIYHLRVPLTKHQRALRRAGHKVKTAFTVTLTPGFGKPVKVKLTRTAAR